MSITIFLSPSNFYFLTFQGSYTCPKSYGHHFPIHRNTFKRQGLVWGLPNRHLHRFGFPHQVRFLRLCGQPVDFLVWLRRLLIAFQTNSRPALKQCFQSNRYARQACENLPKVCPHKRRDLHFDSGRWLICANVCSTSAGRNRFYVYCVGRYRTSAKSASLTKI